jgi:hypothetical protein
MILSAKMANASRHPARHPTEQKCNSVEFWVNTFMVYSWVISNLVLTPVFSVHFVQ